MTAWRVPSDDEIRGVLTQRLDAERDGVSLVIGVVDAAGRRVVAHRAEAFPGGQPPGADTLFEIGSNTKVFTALLLADMAERGEVRLDNPAALLLPPEVMLPEHRGRRITLEHLATHVSGLPRDADNYAPTDRANPFADFTVERLYDFLGRYRLDRDPGATHAYSNVGSGLLGHVLARRGGADFETLVWGRIAAPLGMASTAITLKPELAARAATGHDHSGQPTPWLDLPAIPGAGALRSTANDMLTFLAAALGHVETPLSAAMRTQLARRRPTGRSDGGAQALGWLIASRNGAEVAWHVGRTVGGHGFLGLDLARGEGVVVLGNMGVVRAEDIGFHLLTGSPLAPPPSQREAVRLASEQLERLAGRYRLSETTELTVAAASGHLRIDIGGRATHAFIPESETRFFVRQFDARVTFELGADGRPIALVTHQDGRDHRAPRVD
jgi:CubicO group peptidase (beta-lactamase class C family)